MPAPKVSIITATYNASHILSYAIRSVLLSDFDDWELVIVGDHCTDDTAEVVAAFDDPRIRFVNLPSNSGQQATPNNHGLTLATGEYLCFLNHDDMFLSFHLSHMLEQSRRHPDSVLLARYSDIRPLKEGDAEPDAPGALWFRGAGPSDDAPDYDPLRWQIASSWFMPMALARRVGDWRLEQELYVTPSQDWLFRAWRGGERVVGIPILSVATVCTGKRSHFYSQRRDAVHEYVFDRYVTSDRYHPELVAKSATDGRVRRSVRRALYDGTVCRLSSWLGWHPNSLEMLVRHGRRRGGFIRNWRRGVNLE